MFDFIKRLFRGTPAPEKDDIVAEKWETTFSKPKEIRFSLEGEEGYSSSVGEKGLELKLRKRNFFAWVLDQWYRYRDCVIEGEAAFDEENGYSSLGLVFRYADERNFYYLLVSNRGYARLTVVFNGNPIHLVPWMELPTPMEKEFFFRVILRGKSISFFLDDEWTFEVEDGSIDAGWIGFAAQNYQEKPEARFFLSSLAVNSIPVEVETAYYRWQDRVPPPPKNRVHFARHLFRHRRYSPVVVQLRKASKTYRFSAEEFLLMGEALFGLELFDSALESVEKALTLDREEERPFTENIRKKEALLLKGNILYSLNRFFDARDWCNQDGPELEGEAAFWNLWGNIEYSLGNLEKAAEKYAKAVELDPEVAVFHLNRGRTLERLERKEKAIQSYTETCTVLFRRGEYEEIATIFPAVQQLDPENPKVRGIRGKLLFQEGQLQEAEELFDVLLEEGKGDSSILYLKGLLLQTRSEREEALKYFRKVLAEEPDFGLAWLRVAENLFLLQGDSPPGDHLKWRNSTTGVDSKDFEEAMEKALFYLPEESQVYLLAGEYALSRGEVKRAMEEVDKALQLDPEHTEARILKSRVLFQMQDPDAALKVLPREGDKSGEYANQRGNILAALGRYEEAVEEYEEALRADRDNPVFMENCAAACIEMDMVLRGEELLVKLLDIAPSSQVYNLLANAVRLKGEFPRAEAIYREGLSGEPGNRDLLCNLADLYLELKKYDHARPLLEEAVKEYPKDPRPEKLFSRLREETEIEIRCSSCGKSWTVEKNIPEQPALTIRTELPDGAPAGSCPECGKIYCVACGKPFLREGRFVCPDCGVNLKLNSSYLRYVVASYAQT
jgi:tetratricopeptide (TPR) repeat protein